MAVKRYNGSSWDVVAGVGAQGAAATSSTITTWVKTAAGGETSLSGNDDNSQSLSYTIGQELVFINGSLLKRGSDYTATSGTSITGLTALAANDVATVWSNNAFSVTNAISNTLVDAKGDILVGTAADTPGRLAVGTDGQYLKADSTTGTGLVWATISGPTFSAKRSTTDQTLTANAWNKVQFNSETWDTANNYDPTTNYRFTPTTSGYYQININMLIGATANAWLSLWKNGSEYARLDYLVPSGGEAGGSGSVVVNFNGSTDYVEGYIYASGGTTTVTQNYSVFSGVWIRS